MDSRYVKKRGAGQSVPEAEIEMVCDLPAAVRIMTASGLWQDLREGLDHAETICRDLRGWDAGVAWCARPRRGDRSSGTAVPGIDVLIWPTTPGASCARGGERG